MRLIKLIAKYFARHSLIDLLRRHQQLSPQHPNRNACEQMVELLRPDFFQQYRPSQGKIECDFFYPNVEAYTTKLKELNKTIKDKRPIQSDWAGDIKVTRNTVDAFLVSDDGYYINPEQAVSNFKAASLELCQRMQVSDTAAHGVDEHNLRMLTKLFINLRVVHQRLIEVSLTNA